MQPKCRLCNPVDDFHFIYFVLMPILRSLLPGLLILTGSTASWAQEVPAPASIPDASVITDAAPPSKVLLKLGLNVARSARWGGYSGIPFRVPVTVGVEYWLSPKFTLYGQLDTDFAVRQSTTFLGERFPLVPTAALSLGGRYYYNQAKRAQQNRTHGAFVGNYLAAEIHTEMGYRYKSGGLAAPTELQREFVPTFNLLWGMQRRLSRNFLLDASAGIGVGATRSDLNFGGFSSGPVNLSGQLNLGIYFGR